MILIHISQAKASSSGWWFQTFLFSPLLGEDCHFDEHIFQLGVSTTNSSLSGGQVAGCNMQFSLKSFVFSHCAAFRRIVSVRFLEKRGWWLLTTSLKAYVFFVFLPFCNFHTCVFRACLMFFIGIVVSLMLLLWYKTNCFFSFFMILHACLRGKDPGIPLRSDRSGWMVGRRPLSFTHFSLRSILLRTRPAKTPKTARPFFCKVSF